MSDRDELADEISGWQVSTGYYGQVIPSDVAREIADHLISLGYHKHRVVETPDIENADAFSDGTVIVDSEGEAWQKAGGLWYLAAAGYLDQGPANHLPVTVLQEGGES